MTIAQVSGVLWTLFNVTANRVAKEAGFVRRVRRLTGASFLQGLVFGWLADPDASVEQLAAGAAVAGAPVTPQALDQRLDAAAAGFLRRMVGEAVRAAVAAAEPVAIPLLGRFSQVAIQDATVVKLPESMALVWRGCGGSNGQGGAALKVEVRVDLLRGGVQDLALVDGRRHDSLERLDPERVPEGALHLGDLGLFNLKVFKRWHERKVYWLSRFKAGTAALDRDGRPLDLPALLPRSEALVDRPILLGAADRIPARLVAVRVDEKVAAERRRKQGDEARRRQRPLTEATKALADWTILVTNAPAEKLSGEEALTLARVRWQVELVFKLWKDHGKLDESRSARDPRVEAETYAKLLGQLVQHWAMLVSCWTYADRSWRKTARTIRGQAGALAIACARADTDRLQEAFALLRTCFLRTGRVNPRKEHPNTYQLLLNPRSATY